MQRINLSADYEGIEISPAGQIYIDGNKTRFNIKELVSQRIFNYQGNFALGLIRPSLIRGIHFLRQYFASSIYINTWAYQSAIGSFQQRCFRQMHITTGARYSRHKYGMAVDFNVRGKLSNEVYDEIIANENIFLAAGFTTIEDKSYARTWTHLDVRATNLTSQLLVVGA